MDVPLPLQEEIKKQVALTSQPFAVFDFDNTCIVNDIGEATLAYLCHNKLLKDLSLLGDTDTSADYHERIFTAYHNLRNEGKIKEAYTLNSRMFSGFTPEEATAATRAAIGAEGEEIGKVELYGHSIAHGLVQNPKAMSLLDFVKSLGIDAWVVSASAEVAVKTAMEHFGIGAKLIGVRAGLDGGRFTKELQEPLSVLEGKVACVRAHITESSPPLLAADESMTGIALLEAATIRVVIDRGTPLTQEAQKRGWFIL